MSPVTLRWEMGDLYLGAFCLGETRWHSSAGGRGVSGFQYRVGTNDWSQPYQDVEDVEQDLESEVRRLLKEAGVEVAP